MKILPIVYLSYMFLALYMFFFFLILYFKNKKTIFDYPKAKKRYDVSIIVPCFNEEKSIEATINAILDSDYKGLKKVIIVDDCSTDNSYNIVKKMAEKDDRILLVKTPKNLGRSASAKNFGIQFANTEIIGFSDADSFPEKDAIRKCLGFFNEPAVGAVTCSVLVKNKNKFMEKLQAMEYAIIAWTRKLLGYVDGIWAMPGPLALYRREALEKIGGFDEKNLTEDIEITWHIVSKGYKVEMCLPARVYSIAPSKATHWFKQRVRWDIGGIQCMNKYKTHFLSKLGYFILPFFSISMFLGLVGILIFLYLAARNIITAYFFTQYSFEAGTSLISLQEFYITTSILNIFGVVLFLLGVLFTVFGLRLMKDIKFKGNIFNLMFYMIVYLTVYPLLLIFAIGKMIKYKIQGKKIGWGTK
jgi:biofilm PGA synthesis N-glycosyltransferase PgaC